jgi:hypothetical protein
MKTFALIDHSKPGNEKAPTSSFSLGVVWISRVSLAAAVGLFVLVAGTELARATPMLTADGTALGFSLSQFADQFPTFGGVGPTGIAFPNTGGVMVSDYPGNVRTFPSDVDGQHATTIPVAQNYGPRNGAQLAIARGIVYMARQGAGDLIQLNDNGTFNQTIVTGMILASGLISNPSNGHLFVSTLTTNPNPKINAEQRRRFEAERPPVRSKGRTRQRCSPHTGGPSDAVERSEPATDGQAATAGRVRAPAVDLVQRLGAAPALPAAV